MDGGQTEAASPEHHLWSPMVPEQLDILIINQHKIPKPIKSSRTGIMDQPLKVTSLGSGQIIQMNTTFIHSVIPADASLLQLSDFTAALPADHTHSELRTVINV